MLYLSLLLTHSLVSRRYRRRMVEYENLSLKLPACLWVEAGRHHYHSLPDRRALDFFQGERGRLPTAHFFNRHAFAVDGFDDDGDEDAQRIWTEEQRVVQPY